MRHVAALSIAAVLLFLSGTAAAQSEQLVPRRTAHLASVTGQANTAASHIVAIESGAAKAVRVLKACVTNPGSQTTAGLRVLLLERTTAAGTGGAITAEAANASTAALAAMSLPPGPAFSGIVRAKPTGLGTQGATIALLPIWVPAAAADFKPVCLDFTGALDRPPRAPVGTANGIALRDPGAAGGAGLAAYVEFVEE